MSRNNKKWERMWRKRPRKKEEQEKDLHIGNAEETGEEWKVAIEKMREFASKNEEIIRFA